MRVDPTQPRGIMPGGPDPVGIIAVVITAIIRSIIRGK